MWKNISLITYMWCWNAKKHTKCPDICRVASKYKIIGTIIMEHNYIYVNSLLWLHKRIQKTLITCDTATVYMYKCMIYVTPNCVCYKKSSMFHVKITLKSREEQRKPRHKVLPFYDTKNDKFELLNICFFFIKWSKTRWCNFSAVT